MADVIEFPNSATPQQRHECQLAIGAIEELAELWCKEADIESMAKNIASVAKLNRNAPDEVREQFIKRQEGLIYRMIEQAWIEGALRGSTGAFDLVRAGYVPLPDSSSETA